MTSLVAKKKKKGGRYLKYIKHNILVKSRNATQPKNSSQEFFFPEVNQILVRNAKV